MSQLAKSLVVEETAVVLLRVRDLSRQETPAKAGTPTPAEAQPQAGDAITMPAEPDGPTEPAPAAIAAAIEQDAPSESPQASLARRRDARPPRRDWYYPSLWQGTVGLLLLSLLALACFMVANNGKKNAAVGKSEPAADELREPEISIPEPALSFTMPASAKPEEAKSAGESFEPLASESSTAPSPSPRELNRDSEPAGDRFTRSHPARLEAFGERPALRDEPKPRASAAPYPVTPAQAIYPVTDPGKFRYPDDSRPSDTSAR